MAVHLKILTNFFKSWKQPSIVVKTVHSTLTCDDVPNIKRHWIIESLCFEICRTELPGEVNVGGNLIKMLEHFIKTRERTY
jgi:hypothetical protein